MDKIEMKVFCNRNINYRTCKWQLYVEREVSYFVFKNGTKYSPDDYISAKSYYTQEVPPEFWFIKEESALNKEKTVDFHVFVTPEISEALQKIAFKNGWQWVNGETSIDNLDSKALVVTNDKLCHSPSGEFVYGKKVSIEEAIKRFSQSLEIKIGDHEVKITKTQVKVGCQIIKKKEVEQIVSLIKSDVPEINGEMPVVDFGAKTVQFGINIVSFNTIHKIAERMQ